MNRQLLFVSWDGPQQNYMESLFIPIFAGLKNVGYDVHVLHFTWADAEQIRSVRSAAAAHGISYVRRGVIRRPLAPATGLMIAYGALQIVLYARRHKIEVLMPRSIICAAMALIAHRVLGHVRLVFDADGLMADERVEFGGWSADGRAYQAFRSIERQALRAADVTITRTEQAKEILAHRAGEDFLTGRIAVVPNGKDASVFNPGTAGTRQATRHALGVDERTLLVIYVGSLGPQYLPDQMLAFFRRILARGVNTHLVVLTGNRSYLNSAIAAYPDLEGYMTVGHVPPEEVPQYIATADVGLAFRRPSLSQRAVSPIKVGEYLMCGVPVVASEGIGDLDQQLPATVGHITRGDTEALEGAVTWVIDHVAPNRDALRTDCARAGSDLFGMDSCLERYQSAFERFRRTLDSATT